MRFTIALKQATLCVAMLLCLSLSLFAQTRTVTGRITDASGAAVPGASVTVRGSNTATQSDANGNYSITVPNNATLIISSVGFGSREISVAGASSFDATLVTTSSNLNEVVVIGYGSRRVKDATGSVAAITPKDFNKGVISTPEQLIQGRTPGVVVTPSSGEPGAAATINIRGTSSIRGSNDPLYVVDGVPLDGGGTSGTASGIEGNSTPKNPLLFLNPNDIESISILKDASSAAIYGSRGANGVIIITTKSGRGGKGAFTFNATTSVARTYNRYDVLNRQQFLDGVVNANVAAGTPRADAETAVRLLDKGADIDWQDEIFRTAISQQYNLGWGFSRKNTNLRLSGSYDDQQGIVKKTGLKRLTGRANFGQKLFNDKLRIDGTFTASNVKNQYAPLTNNAGYQGSLVGAALGFNPTYPIRNNDGSFFDPGDGNRNPVQLLEYFNDNDNINRYLTNISGSYQIVQGLTYKATFGYDYSKSLRKSFADPRLGTAVAGGTTNVNNVNYNNTIFGNGRAVYQDLERTSQLVEHTLTLDRKIGKTGASHLNALLGYAFQRTEFEGEGRVGWGLSTPVTSPTDNFIQDINNFTNIKPAYIPFNSREDLQSIFGRAEYSINDKYIITGTIRRDGSSKFGVNNKYGTFPAFAAKWRINQETFAATSLNKIFSEFSIRANYGKLGSQDGLDAYSASNLSRIWFNNLAQTTVDTSLVFQGNDDLKWEEATTTGVGIDWAVSSNRLSGTVDYYYTKRENLIFFGPTPGGFSATSNYFSNLPGYVRNTGLEFTLNATPVKNQSFTWDINYNMTFLKNRLEGFSIPILTGAVSGQGLSGAYAQVINNGLPLFSFNVLDFQGFDKDGFAIYGNNASPISAGSALPTFIAGLTNNFTYGRWNASIFFNTSRGFYVYNNTANALFLKGALKNGRNVTVDVANSNESPINPGSPSTRFLEKGDFIRLSNALIGYNFALKNKKVIKSLSANITGQNLWLITNYSGLDPEVNVDKNINGVPSRGFDYTGYPRPRIFTFGINLGF